MGSHSVIQLWLINSMLILGIFIFLLGLWIVILPANFLKAGQLLNKWITTDHYFDYMDKPLYQERIIYKYHRLTGALIVLGASYSLAILLLGMDINAIYARFPMIINHFWSQWFYSTAYYLLAGANFLAVVIGIIVFLRPSKLKNIELVMNRWIATSPSLKKLDQTHHISTDILPGNPRLFGMAVTLGGLYMALSMGVMLL